MAVHELTHALGRAEDLQYEPNTYAALDFYRFASPGQRELTGGVPAYFSLNDGATNLASFDITSDDSDWAGANGADSIDAYGNPGVVNPVSSVDLEVLGALGFSVGTVPTVNSVSSSSTRTPAGIGSTVFISLAFNESMTVFGSPTLSLNNGTTASYASGSGSPTVAFAYTVVARRFDDGRGRGRERNYSAGDIGRGGRRGFPAAMLQRRVSDGRQCRVPGGPPGRHRISARRHSFSDACMAREFRGGFPSWIRNMP